MTEHALPSETDAATVLVVDDEASVREVTKATLESFGYRVRTATDGADAVAQFAALGNLPKHFRDRSSGPG